MSRLLNKKRKSENSLSSPCFFNIRSKKMNYTNLWLVSVGMCTQFILSIPLMFFNDKCSGDIWKILCKKKHLILIAFSRKHYFHLQRRDLFFLIERVQNHCLFVLKFAFANYSSSVIFLWFWFMHIHSSLYERCLRNCDDSRCWTCLYHFDKKFNAKFRKCLGKLLDVGGVRTKQPPVEMTPIS